MISGWISRSGYQAQLRGDSQVQSLFRFVRAAGIGVPQTKAEGHANVDVQIAGSWAEPTLPRAVGSVQLRGIQAEMRGVNEPLEIASANLVLKPEVIEVHNVSAAVGKTNWRGSLVLPRPCVGPVNCPFHFDLRVDKLDAAVLGKLLDPIRVKRPWYSFFTAQTPSFLAAMNASGKLLAKQVVGRGITGNQFSGDVEMKAGEIRLQNIHGNIFGGHYAGDWTAQLGAKPLTIHSSGTLDHIDLGQLATALHGDWASGTASAKYQITASGANAVQALSSTAAQLQIHAVDGLLPHISLALPGPVRLRRFSGELSYHNGNFTLQNSKLETLSGIYAVSGTATFANGLDLKLARERASGFTISGTLSNPHIAETEAPPTRVALKR